MSQIALGLLMFAILRTGYSHAKLDSASEIRLINYCLIFGGKCQQKCDVTSQREFAQFHLLCGVERKCCKSLQHTRPITSTQTGFHDSWSKYLTPNGTLVTTSSNLSSTTPATLPEWPIQISTPLNQYSPYRSPTTERTTTYKTPNLMHFSPFSKDDTKMDTSFINYNEKNRYKGCGVPVLSRVRRIVGGTRASRCRYPWMVHISRDPLKDDVCGGTLVSNRHIITAAHCYDYLATWPTLTIGEFDRRDNNSRGKLITSSYKITVHPDYSRFTFSRDIAILTLHIPIQFENYECLYPICLPPEDKILKVGDTCKVAGWGSTSKTADHPAVSSPSLMETDIQILNDSFCKNKFGILFNGGSQLCAGDLTGSRDSCVGDSGGPLMCNFPSNSDASQISTQFLMGVISSGSNPCAQVGTPALYTDLQEVRKWIHNVTDLLQ